MALGSMFIRISRKLWVRSVPTGEQAGPERQRKKEVYKVSLKVQIQNRETEIVGKGTIDGIVPFYFKDQGHRWMVRIGQDWTLKQKEAGTDAVPSAPKARNRMYWAIAQFRNQSRISSSASTA